MPSLSCQECFAADAEHIHMNSQALPAGSQLSSPQMDAVNATRPSPPCRSAPPAWREPLDRAGSLLEVTGSRALRAQAQQQAALELLQARRLGADDALLCEVLQERIQASVAQLLEGSEEAPPTTREQQQLTPSSSSSAALIEAVERLMKQLEAEPADAPPDRDSWKLALACHGRMVAVKDQDRMEAIAHAIAGARLIGILRQRGVSLPDWLLHHEEQLCRYGGLWIHEQLLAPGLDRSPTPERAERACQGVALLKRLDQIHGGDYAWIGYHLTDLQVEASRTTAAQPIQIAIAGNCQYWPLFQYLESLLPSAQLIPGPSVHLATAEQVSAFHESLRSVDVLLMHRVKPGYRDNIGLDNKTLWTYLSAGARQLVLPNLHYEGHHPWIGYALDPEGRLTQVESMSPLGHYHDFLAMQAALRGLSAEVILEHPLHPDLADQIRQNHHGSLQQLRKREVDCDVEISSWIEQHHRHMPVAHTCNHPTRAPLHALLLRVLEALDLHTTVDPTHLNQREYLGGLSIPILPWVSQALELGPWSAEWGSRAGQHPFPIEVQLQRSISFYREYPWIAEQNQQVEKFRWAGSVLDYLSENH